MNIQVGDLVRIKHTEGWYIVVEVLGNGKLRVEYYTLFGSYEESDIFNEDQIVEWSKKE